MAVTDGSVAITAGSGTNVDTVVIGTDHRQVMVIGDPEILANRALVNAAGALTVEMSIGSNGATVTTFTNNSTPNSAILAADTTRIGITIYNDVGGSNLNIYLGAGTQTSGNWSLVIPPGGLYEFPQEYVGLRVVGYFTTATAAAIARITAVS